MWVVIVLIPDQCVSIYFAVANKTWKSSGSSPPQPPFTKSTARLLAIHKTKLSLAPKLRQTRASHGLQ